MHIRFDICYIFRYTQWYYYEDKKNFYCTNLQQQKSELYQSLQFVREVKNKEPKYDERALHKCQLHKKHYF